MATFKITVDDHSDLGRHLCSLSPKARSREVYFLSSLGLLSLKGDGESAQIYKLVTDKNENMVKSSADSKRDGSPNVHEGINLKKENVVSIHGSMVDFGDEITCL